MKKKIADNTITMVTMVGEDDLSTVSESSLKDEPILVPEVVEQSNTHETEPNMELKKKQGRSGRFKRFVKKHFLTRRNGPTNVQEIHIVPDGDDLKWARRSAGSAVSRSSGETTASEEDRLEIVHDMAEEYFPDSVL